MTPFRSHSQSTSYQMPHISSYGRSKQWTGTTLTPFPHFPHFPHFESYRFRYGNNISTASPPQFPFLPLPSFPPFVNPKPQSNPLLAPFPLVHTKPFLPSQNPLFSNLLPLPFFITLPTLTKYSKPGTMYPLCSYSLLPPQGLGIGIEKEMGKGVD